MEIKVKNIKQHYIHIKGKKPFDEWEDRILAEAKLVLIDKKHYISPYRSNLNFTPILISETEKIKNNDKFLFQGKHVETAGNEGIKNYYELQDTYKILALPEHFSKEQLQMIVDGKLKDGDNVYVECENGPLFSDNSEGKQAIINPEKEWKEYRVKSPLSIYPIEEKLYTREETQALFNKYNQYLEQWADRNKYVWGIYNGNTALNFDSFIEKVRSKEWFEQNVK